MLAEISTELIIILVLTLANGFFAGSEIAIVSARRSRLEAMAEEGRRSAIRALNLAENPDRFLATVQIGITLIGTFSAAFGGARISRVLETALLDIPTLAPYAETLSLLIVVGGITYVSLILGELVPKRLALRYAERLAVIAAPIMDAMAIIARPVITVLTWSVNGVMWLLGQSTPQIEEVTEDDIFHMVRTATETGTVEMAEAQFIQRIFRFTDRPVHTMMTPRTQIVGLKLNTSLPEIIDLISTQSYSRLPVYDETLDQIRGILHIKDLMPIVLNQAPLELMKLIRTPIFVVESAPADDVLLQFRQQGAHMAFVIDEYGQIAGLVTLEDLLEELVGEIRDEYDMGEERAYIQREDGSWLVDGLEPLDRVRQIVSLVIADVAEDEYTTLAGFILDHMERLPSEGDVLRLGDYRFEVMDMDGRRIDKVLISRADASQ